MLEEFGTKRHIRYFIFGFIALSISLKCFGSVNVGSTIWYESQEGSRLSANGSGVEWDPVHDRTVFVDLGDEYRLAMVGDKVTFSCEWSSSGDVLSGCISDCEDEGSCNFDDDVSCLAGTGDFRMGLFDSNRRGIVSSDGFENCGENPMFWRYLGYHWRFHPHICQGNRFTQSTGESHTNVSMWKRDNLVSSDNCISNLLGDCGGVCPDDKDPRPNSRKYGPAAACFDLAIGGWAPLVMEVERVSNGVKTSFTFNGQSFSYTETSPSYRPDSIDVLAIHFSNARPYDYVILDSITITSTLAPSPTITFSSPSSYGMEGMAIPLEITVNLVNGEAGETYTVDYAVVSGSAEGCGVDYFSEFSSCDINDLSLLCSNWLWSGSEFNPSNLYGIDSQVDFKDYSLLSGLWNADGGTLVFAPGETSKTFEVDIMDDDLIEDIETVELQLSNPTGVDIILDTDVHTLTLFSNDYPS